MQAFEVYSIFILYYICQFNEFETDIGIIPILLRLSENKTNVKTNKPLSLLDAIFKTNIVEIENIPICYFCRTLNINNT